jgi:DNA-directed RNA polymerase subunit K/omega
MASDEGPPAGRKTAPQVSKYEFARLMGERVRQLSANSPPLVPVDGKMTMLQIASLEFASGLFPLKLARRMPSGAVEEWSPRDLEVIAEKSMHAVVTLPPGSSRT